jgi:anti-sigma-K factor RskA
MTGAVPAPEDHREFDELAVGWALRALEPEDEAVFSAHLATCARCADTVAETTEVMAAMSADLPRAEPSDDLRIRLRAAVQETEQLSVEQVTDPPATGSAVAQSRPAGEVVPLPRWRRALPAALVAAALATIVGLGLWTVVLNSDREELRSTVAEQSRMVEELLTAGQATIAPMTDDGREVATVVARDDELTVVTQGLAANDVGTTTYVVWGLEGAEATALGIFDVNGSQMEFRTVGSGLTGLDGYPAYGISLEPGRQAPSEPTDVVATGQVTS